MSIRTDIPIAAGSDDALSLQNNTGFSDVGQGAPNSYFLFTQHINTTLNNCIAWRFKIPDTILKDDVETVKVGFVTNNSGAGFASAGSILVEPGPAAGWANDVTNVPSKRFDDAVAAGVTPISWTVGSHAAGSRMYTVDVAAQVKVAMAHPSYVPGTSYISVIAKAPIGSPYSMQIFNADNTISLTKLPRLRITSVGTPVYDPITSMGLGYSDGQGYTTYQYMDIYVPGGDPGPTGRPCVVWFHGGFWRTGFASKDEMNVAFKDYCLSQGWVFINAEYNRVQYDILLSNTGPSHPYPIHDARTLKKWIDSVGQDEFRIDPNKCVITGESAGGNIALETVITQGDTNVYTGYQNIQGNRYNTIGRVRPQFDFHRGLTVIPYAGACSWVGPVYINNLPSNPDGLINIAVNLGRTGYMGEKQGSDPSTTTGFTDECDINRYIMGNTAPGGPRCYTGPPRQPSKPLCYIYGGVDPVIRISDGIDPLIAALRTEGFTYEIADQGKISKTGLSHYCVTSGDHTKPQDNPNSWSFFAAWMKQAILGEPAPWKSSTTVVISSS